MTAKTNGKNKEAPRISHENGRTQIRQAEREKDLHNTTREGKPKLDRVQRRVYREALLTLNESGLPYTVAAAFARHIYTNIWRKTKDLDIFVLPADLKPIFSVLEDAGFQTEIRAEHWLAKAWKEDHFIDIIFGMNNGIVSVTPDMFEGSKEAKILGIPTRLIPLEEMIALSCYVAGRTRFDGPEILHLIRASKGKLDWERILARLGDNRQLLLWQLILFDFVYPGHSSYLPREIMVDLFAEMKDRWENPPVSRKKFRGTLLDSHSYTVDVKDWGYEDARQQDPVVDKKGDPI